MYKMLTEHLLWTRHCPKQFTDVTYSALCAVSEVRWSRFVFWLQPGVAIWPRVLHGFTLQTQCLCQFLCRVFLEVLTRLALSHCSGFSSSERASWSPMEAALPTQHCFTVTRLVSLQPQHKVVKSTLCPRFDFYMWGYIHELQACILSFYFIF